MYIYISPPKSEYFVIFMNTVASIVSVFDITALFLLPVHVVVAVAVAVIAIIDIDVDIAIDIIIAIAVAIIFISFVLLVSSHTGNDNAVPQLQLRQRLFHILIGEIRYHLSLLSIIDPTFPFIFVFVFVFVFS